MTLWPFVSSEPVSMSVKFNDHINCTRHCEGMVEGVLHKVQGERGPCSQGAYILCGETDSTHKTTIKHIYKAT